jgi:hypothetical protein
MGVHVSSVTDGPFSGKSIRRETIPASSAVITFRDATGKPAG